MLRELDKETVHRLFDARHGTSVDIIISIYKLVFPDWDNIKSINGWPTINNETSKQIFKWFIAFDQKHTPGVLPGGLWMNKGFSTLKGDSVPDWVVDMSTCTVRMNE